MLLFLSLHVISVWPLAEYKLVHVSYATGEPYRTSQRNKHESIAKMPGVSSKMENHESFSAMYDPMLFNVTFLNGSKMSVTGGQYRRSIESLARPKYGFNKDPAVWIWKPFLILRTMRDLAPGDAVLYSDSSRYVTGGYKNNLRKLSDAIFAAGASTASKGIGVAGTCLPLTLQSEWAHYMSHSICRREQTPISGQFTFSIVAARLCSATPASDLSSCVSNYHNKFMQQASWLVVRKNKRTIKFLRHWLALLHNQPFLFTAPMQDQDAMTLAAIQTGYPCAWFPSSYYVKYFTPRGKLMGKDLKGLDYIIEHLIPSVQIISQNISSMPSQLWSEHVGGKFYKYRGQAKHKC